MSDHSSERSRFSGDDDTLRQLQTAREAEEAIKTLHRTQQQLLELEQRRLQSENQRRDEELASKAALRERAERRRETRLHMAALELEVKTFRDDLVRNELMAKRFEGVVLASHRFALIRKRLSTMTELMAEMDDLADIRFFGELQYSIEHVASSQTELFGSAPMKDAAKQLDALLDWHRGQTSVGAETVRPLELHTQCRVRVDGWPSSMPAILEKYRSLEMLREAEGAAVQVQKQADLAAMGYQQLWSAVSPVFNDLTNVRVGRGEREYVTGKSEPSLEQQIQSIAGLKAEIDAHLALLEKARVTWQNDHALVEEAKTFLKVEQFGAAEKSISSAGSARWTDIDFALVTQALDSALQKMLDAVDADSQGSRRRALSLLDDLVSKHSDSATVRDGLVLRRDVLLGEHQAKMKSYQRRFTGVFVVLVVGALYHWASNFIEQFEFQLPQGLPAAVEAQKIAAQEFAKDAREAAEGSVPENGPKAEVPPRDTPSAPINPVDELPATAPAELAAPQKAPAPVPVPVLPKREPTELQVVDMAADKAAFESGFKRIPAGVFQMGDPSESGAPVHEVMVREFHISTTEIPFGEWKTIKTWAEDAGYSFENSGRGKTNTHPVSEVSWYDAVKWCNARSERAGLTPCYYLSASRDSSAVYRQGVTALTLEMIEMEADGYRLPTEAEWEKAARGGVPGRRFPNGNVLSSREANFCNVGGNTLPVKYYIPNPYGLHEMAGNVMEWCQDSFGADYYRVSSANDPTGPGTVNERVVRGGSWTDPKADSCRVAGRLGHPPESVSGNKGFRLVRRLPSSRR